MCSSLAWPNGRPSPVARPRSLRTPAVSAQVWWSSSSSRAATTCGGGLAELGGRPRPGQGKGVVLAAGQPGVAGDCGVVLGDGDVGEQQAGHPLAFSLGGGRVVPYRGEVTGQLGDTGLLGAGEAGGGRGGGLVVGVPGVVQLAQRGVPAGFEGGGDQPVAGVDGEVAPSGGVGVVACALDDGGAELVRVAGAVLELGGDGEGGLDRQRGEGADEQPP